MNENVIARYRKAIAGFLAPGVALLVVAVTAGSDGGTSVTAPEWVGIIAAVVMASAAVAVVPNQPASVLPEPEPVDDDGDLPSAA